MHVDTHVVGDAAVGQGLGQGFVGVDKAGVLADYGDAHFALGLDGALDDVAPAIEVRRRRLYAKVAAHLIVQAALVIADRYPVDGVHVEGWDHRLSAHVAEQRDLAAFRLGNFPVGAAQQHVGLDADAQQFFHRVLGRLCLHLARRRDERQQGQV